MLGSNIGFMKSAGGGVTYATWNPLDKDSLVNLSGGNLVMSAAGINRGGRATMGKSSGKWAWKITMGGSFTAGALCGIGTASAALNNYVGSDINGIGYHSDGGIYRGGSRTSYGSTYAVGSIITIYIDMTAGTLSFDLNGVPQGVAATGLTGIWFPLDTIYSSDTHTANFGQTPFTPPSGYNMGLY